MIDVGARWNAAIREITCRFSSSGKGVSVVPVRSPASTWPTGIRRLNAASAAAAADEVSPWTSAVTGNPLSRICSRVATAAPVAWNRSRQNASSRADHRRDELVQRQSRTPDVEIEVGLDRRQVEDRLHEVTVLPGRDDDGREPRAPLERVHDREHLDRLGPRPDQDEDVAALTPDGLAHLPSLTACQESAVTSHRCSWALPVGRALPPGCARVFLDGRNSGARPSGGHEGKQEHRFAPDTPHPDARRKEAMFRISAITRVGLVAVACVAVAAPSALAKPPVKGGKAKVAKVQSLKKAASSSNDNVVLRTGLSTAYAQGCQNGTLPDRTTGGDNNNYEYYGDVCTVSVPLSPDLALRAASAQTAATPSAGRVVFMFDDNTNYEYYGRP